MVDIDKKYQKNIITRKDMAKDKKTILRFCPSVDAALAGGLPSGQMIEISGKPKVGKTTLVLTWIADAIRQGYESYYFDVEHRLSNSLLDIAKIGEEKFHIIRSSPDNLMYGEQMFELLEQLIKDLPPSLFVLDSVPALAFSEEMDPDKRGKNVGILSKKLTAFIKIIQHIVAMKKHYLIFLNHQKESINFHTRVSSKYTPGGLHLQHQCSTLLELVFMGRLSTPSGDQFGHKVLFSFKSAANTAPSKTLLELHYNKGFALEHDVIEVCKQIGLVSLAGSWYSYGEEENLIRRQGVPKLIQAIKKKGRWDTLIEQCYQNMGLTAP